jgi:hypothetical protein
MALTLSAMIAIGGCAPQKQKPEDFGPRFEAASRIRDVAAHDQALVKIADDAMVSDNAGATSWAIAQINDSAVRDQIAEKATDHYVSIGRNDVAGAIAESISDDAKRDKVMQKLAETAATKPARGSKR